jgi:hypothetical protein
MRASRKGIYVVNLGNLAKKVLGVEQVGRGVRGCGGDSSEKACVRGTQFAQSSLL